MKTLKIALTILTMTPFISISQTSKKPDTSCIANEKLREAVILIEEGKLYRQENDVLKEKITNLESQLKNRDSAINYYASKERDLLLISTNFDNYVKTSKKQIENLEVMHGMVLKQIGRQKKQKLWVAILGLISSVSIQAWHYYGR